jgi:hypothetical protein
MSWRSGALGTLPLGKMPVLALTMLPVTFSSDLSTASVPFPLQLLAISLAFDLTLGLGFAPLLVPVHLLPLSLWFLSCHDEKAAEIIGGILAEASDYGKVVAL